MTYTASMSEDDNIGSVRSIKMALARTLSSINPVAFTSGANWEDMDFMPESASLKDSSADTANGTVYSYALVLGFNKQSVALYDAFKKYLGITGVALVIDSNGLSRIIGSPKNPVTIKHDADTGQAYTSLNFYKLTLNWQSEKPAPVVTT